MNEHPLPWSVILIDNDPHAYIMDAESNQVARLYAKQADVAEYIVACANFCKGFSTEKLAAMPSGMLYSQLAALAAAGATESEGGEA